MSITTIVAKIDLADFFVRIHFPPNLCLLFLFEPGFLFPNRTDRSSRKAPIEKNENEVFATTPAPTAAHFATVSGILPELSDNKRPLMS